MVKTPRYYGLKILFANVALEPALTNWTRFLPAVLNPFLEWSSLSEASIAGLISMMLSSKILTYFAAYFYNGSFFFSKPYLIAKISSSADYFGARGGSFGGDVPFLVMDQSLILSLGLFYYMICASSYKIRVLFSWLTN